MITMKRNLLFVWALLALVAGCKQQSKEDKNPQQTQADISGAGATFPLPYYNVIFKDYTKKTGNKVNYGGIGSGGGIRSLKDKTVDFGASDAFLSDKEIEEFPDEIVHIPTCMGAVVLAYHLPGISGLRLSGALVADIFLGNIGKWNDSRISALNPDISLPDQIITPVYRSDGSGTTFVFSDYLAKVSDEWAKEMGVGKSLKWAVGIAAKGNPGVAGTVQQTVGTIGYIGSEYALSLEIAMAKMQNKAGNFVEVTSETIAAAANVALPEDMRTMLTDSPEPNAYPISCFTWIIVYKNQTDESRPAGNGKAVVDLLNYILSEDAQAFATNVHYAPLPEKALENAKNLVKSIVFQ
jgi:phosphate transport system substrate-binding protein